MLTLVLLAALTGDLPFESHGGGSSTPPDVTDAPHTRVRLVAREDSGAPGAKIDVAIVLESDEGWHTYWKNPGDAGMATSVTWTLPKAWKAAGLTWPAPSRFQEGAVATFGYAGTTRLLSRIETAGPRTGAAAVTAHVEWLECREVCLPGAADVTLTFPLEASAKDPEAFAIARARVPEPTPADWKISAAWTKEKTLRVALATPVALAVDTDFFPDEPGILEPSVPVKLTPGAKGGYSLELMPARMAVGKPSMLEGVLVSGGRAWHVRVPLPPRENR